MAITSDSYLKLLHVPIAMDNKNQLTFNSVNEQYQYFNGLESLVGDDFKYIRKDNIIRFPEHIDSLLEYNYVMYQNSNYSNKWFYAFITDMIYVNDHMTEIKIKTDVWQTWQFDLNFKRSFVEREHVLDDTIGVNTVPENLETGEYICNAHEKDSFMDSYSSDLCYIVASTSEPISGDAKDTVAPSGIYNGIYTGLSYYRYDLTSAIDVTLELFANSGKTDAINTIFMCPKWLAPLNEESFYREVEQSKTPKTYDVGISKQASLNGYIPKNKKLLCYPYNYLLVSNNIGQNAVMHYEKFSTSNCVFNVKGVISPGCNISITPLYYNGANSNDNERIGLGKFPICNFKNDIYTNWLAQNSINILGATVTADDINLFNSILNGTVSTIISGASGNAFATGMSILGGAEGIINSLISKQAHEMIPSSVKGQLNQADLNVASGNNTFHFYKMTIKKEYAKIIDNFFSMFGYKVNEVKVPNLNTRVNWNYVKTINSIITADIPQNDLQEIKNMFDNGITLWHNPATFLDYSQNN